MATQTIQFDSVSLSEIGSGTITALLFSGTTQTASLSTITENATLKGQYTGTVTDIAAGTYRLVVKFDGYTISEPEYQVTLGAPEATYVAASNIATQTSVDALPTATLTALGTGTWLTAIPWNAAWDAEVQSECNDALVALDLDSALIAQGAERAVSVDNSHRVHSHVYDMQANTLTASALAADAVAEIQSGLSTVTLAQIGTEVAGRLNAYDGPTKAEMDAAVATLVQVETMYRWTAADDGETHDVKIAVIP